MVMGWLIFSEAGRKFDCINSPNTAYPVPVHVEDVESIQLTKTWIKPFFDTTIWFNSLEHSVSSFNKDMLYMQIG